MAIRFYLCDVLGTGSSPSDAFHAAVIGLLSPEPDWHIHDCRVDDTQAAGKMLAWADVTSAQHSILVGGTGVTYVPFEDDAGNPLTRNDPIGSINSTKRTQIQNFMENNHVPMQGLTLTDSIYTLLRRFFARCRIRQYLKANDYTELLDAKVSSIPAAKRQAITTELEARGFDLTGIGGQTTIREALRLLIIQDNVAF